jgi:hypothetical protein
MRCASILALALAAATFSTGSAAADGLPLPVEDVGRSGVLSPDGSYRYVTVQAGRDTVVERISTEDGRVSDTVRIPGEYTIPAVGIDGSPGGLSGDGSTLVLISPRQSFPRKTTAFVRLDAADLHEWHPFVLEGDFSFDALSPNGKTMYVINYTSRRDLTEYHVRAYDLAADTLRPGTISDPDEGDEEMYGYALSRTTSVDGRWAYTLYWGREHPFVHALDLVDGVADCIDVEEMPRNTDMWNLQIDRGAGGSYLVISERTGKPLLTVDPVTHTVGEIPTGDLAAAVGRGDANPPRASAAAPWIGVGAVGVGLALAALVGVLAVRRRPRVFAS